MIVIQVKVATISLFSIAALFLNVVPAVLGLILATREYSRPSLSHHTSIQAPAAFTAASALVCVISHAAGVAWPYKFSVAAVNTASAALLGASGIYFVTELFKRASVVVMVSVAKNATSLRLETAFVIMWLLCVLANVALPFFALGALYVATGGPNSDLDVLSISNDVDAEQIYEKPMPSSPNMLGGGSGIGRGIGIDPLSQHFPLDDPLQLSPRLSWASSIRSFETPPPQALGASSIVLTPQNMPGSISAVPNLAPGVSSPLSSPVVASPVSPSKPPRSPLRVHLSKSSFSLKRAGSKSSLASPRVPPPQLQQQQHLQQPHLQSPLRGAASSSAILAENAAATPDLKPPKSWVIVPNENTAESRSVSGSSQLTGRIFPAAEYNRKLNAAGFERDEPVPVHVQIVRPTVSQYDLEQMHRQRPPP